MAAGSEGPPSSGSSHPSTELEGIGGSAGFAIGPAYVLDPGRLGVVHRRIKTGQVEAEIARFDAAVTAARRELREAIDRVKGRGSPASGAEVSILEAYALMVEDPMLLSGVHDEIQKNHLCAEWALEIVSGGISDQLLAHEDPYLAERSHDVVFVRDRILGALTGQERRLIATDHEPVILVAHDLSPAETATLTRDNVLAIVTEVGTRTSHTSILARALEIPAVVGVRSALQHIASGDMLVVDGVHGRVVVSPDEARLDELQPRAERYYEIARGLRELKDEPAQTACGVPVDVQANIELAVEAEIALSHGARGVGLYRTEFLYIERPTPPTEDEQYEAYKKVVEIMAPLPVTLRTFDIGGDKFVTSIRMPHEMNPALGLRAVRLGLERPELLKTQLRAMVPMVASLNEVRAVKALLSESVREVEARGHAHDDHIPLGCMIEVPSAAIMADEFAREVDFLSIGTNDLVQYSLAVDRSSRELARLASYFDPSVVRLIKGVIQAANFRKRSVSVCGAMASDPLAALLLVGMGLRSLSMEASAIPEVKAALGRVTLAEVEDAAGTAFECTTAHELEQSIAERFAPLIGDLLDPN
jgi:phosphotransferase system enzyme I (PtsI)